MGKVRWFHDNQNTDTDVLCIIDLLCYWNNTALLWCGFPLFCIMYFAYVMVISLLDIQLRLWSAKYFFQHFGPSATKNIVFPTTRQNKFWASKSVDRHIGVAPICLISGIRGSKIVKCLVRKANILLIQRWVATFHSSIDATQSLSGREFKQTYGIYFKLL